MSNISSMATQKHFIKCVTYVDMTIEKVKCVGQIQKLMGTRLKKLKQENKTIE